MYQKTETVQTVVDIKFSFTTRRVAIESHPEVLFAISEALRVIFPPPDDKTSEGYTTAPLQRALQLTARNAVFNCSLMPRGAWGYCSLGCTFGEVQDVAVRFRSIRKHHYEGKISIEKYSEVHCDKYNETVLPLKNGRTAFITTGGRP